MTLKQATILKQFITLTMALMLAGCGIKPNAHSGGDGQRNEAQDLILEEWVTDPDGVNYQKGDRTDWKKIMIDRPGTLFVETAFDNKNAAVAVGLYNKYGLRLIEKMKKRGSTRHVRFEIDINQGKYFVSIQCKTSSDNSEYSIRASMIGTSGVGNIPRPE
ncbi:MAG TPA: hypothetical protein EYN06_04940 [Myxococcales bacterium]|nr:hypothetical protein [Myxococcales bacterium]HIN85808.1 hypothetical protein [Myxococcales bacterium]